MGGNFKNATGAWNRKNVPWSSERFEKATETQATKNDQFQLLPKCTQIVCALKLVNELHIKPTDISAKCLF